MLVLGHGENQSNTVVGEQAHVTDVIVELYGHSTSCHGRMNYGTAQCGAVDGTPVALPVFVAVSSLLSFLHPCLDVFR